MVDKTVIWDELKALDVAGQFKLIYDRRLWSGSGKRETICGAGSTMHATAEIKEDIEKFLKDYDVSSIVDCGCGDFFWMQFVNMNRAEYTGVDIVDDIIEDNKIKYPEHTFLAGNIIETIPPGEVVIIRDVLQHLSLADNQRIIENAFSSATRFVIASSYVRDKYNCETLCTKYRKRNLMLEPFNLPEPLLYLRDGAERRKLGVWNAKNRLL